jgi:hypothetical protein
MRTMVFHPPTMQPMVWYGYTFDSSKILAFFYTVRLTGCFSLMCRQPPPRFPSCLGNWSRATRHLDPLPWYLVFLCPVPIINTWDTACLQIVLPPYLVGVHGGCIICSVEIDYRLLLILLLRSHITLLYRMGHLHYLGCTHFAMHASTCP